MTATESSLDTSATSKSSTLGQHTLIVGRVAERVVSVRRDEHGSIILETTDASSHNVSLEAGERYLAVYKLLADPTGQRMVEGFHLEGFADLDTMRAGIRELEGQTLDGLRVEFDAAYDLVVAASTASPALKVASANGDAVSSRYHRVA